MLSGTVVQKRTSDPNRRPQPTGVSKHSPESRRSLDSRTAIAKRNAGSIRSQDPNCGLEQQSQTEWQSIESYKKKTVAVVFCIGAVTPTELTLRQSHNRCTNPNQKANFQCFGGCCNVVYTTLAVITKYPLPCSDVPLSEKLYHAASLKYR